MVKADLFQPVEVIGGADGQDDVVTLFVCASNHLEGAAFRFLGQHPEVLPHFVIAHQLLPYFEAEEGGRGGHRGVEGAPLREIEFVLCSGKELAGACNQ